MDFTAVVDLRLDRKCKPQNVLRHTNGMFKIKSKTIPRNINWLSHQLNDSICVDSPLSMHYIDEINAIDTIYMCARIIENECIVDL